MSFLILLQSPPIPLLLDCGRPPLSFYRRLTSFPSPSASASLSSFAFCIRSFLSSHPPTRFSPLLRVLQAVYLPLRAPSGLLSHPHPSSSHPYPRLALLQPVSLPFLTQVRLHSFLPCLLHRHLTFPSFPLAKVDKRRTVNSNFLPHYENMYTRIHI